MPDDGGPVLSITVCVSLDMTKCSLDEKNKDEKCKDVGIGAQVCTGTAVPKLSATINMSPGGDQNQFQQVGSTNLHACGTSDKPLVLSGDAPSKSFSLTVECNPINCSDSLANGSVWLSVNSGPPAGRAPGLDDITGPYDGVHFYWVTGTSGCHELGAEFVSKGAIVGQNLVTTHVMWCDPIAKK
jgi:hypothetical protein